MVVVAGGIGLAPLRPVVHELLAQRERYGDVSILYGGRSPAELLYVGELERWRARFDVDVDVTVDVADAGLARARRRGAAAHPARRLRPRARRRHDVRPRGDDALHRRGAAATAGVADDAILLSLERSMKCAHRALRALPARPAVHLQGRARCCAATSSSRSCGCASCERQAQPRGVEVRVVRRLPAVAPRLRGRAAGARRRDRHRLLPGGGERERLEGPYDLSLVEGSITTAARRRAHPRDARALARGSSRIGACATAGGIQALRNFADVEDFVSVVYASPQYISTLADSTPIVRRTSRSTSSSAAARSTRASCSR